MKKSDSIYLSAYKEEYEKCTFCGNCRMVCPVFLEEKKESASTRGRITLIGGLLENRLDYNKNVITKLNMCVNCRECYDICPSKVDFSKLIMTAKAEYYLHNKKRVSDKFLYYSILSDNKMRKKFFGIIAKLQKSFFLKLLFKRAFYLFFGVKKNRVMPHIAGKYFFSKSKRKHDLHTEYKKKVYLFLGCSGTYIYPKITEYLISILRKSSIEVSIAKEQKCCGYPHIERGFVDKAKQIAKDNLKIFNGYSQKEAIITMCDTCKYSLTNLYSKFLKVGEFKLPVYDIMYFLDKENINLVQKMHNMNIVCYFSNREREAARVKQIDKMVKRVYADNYLGEIKDRLGSNGNIYDYSSKNFDTNDNITRKFIDKAKFLKADIIALNSSSDILKLKEFVLINKIDIMIVHIIELFDVNSS